MAVLATISMGAVGIAGQNCCAASGCKDPIRFLPQNPNAPVVILNLSEVDRMCQLWVQGQVIKHTAPPHAIVTMTF